jgi:hypothetical protein
MTPRHLLASATRGVAAALEVAVDGYNACPLATHALAERARDAHAHRAQTTAMADPEYAAIQAHRAKGRSAPGSVPTMAEEHNICWAEFKAQQRISRRLTPTPLWWPLAAFVAGRPARRLATHARSTRQRATRGWSDHDTWDLNAYLCLILAGALNHMADCGYGLPGTPDYPGYHDWTEAMRTAAAALNRWATHEDDPGAKVALRAVELTGTQYRAAADAEFGEYLVRLAGAQDALRWVADNLGALGD